MKRPTERDRFEAWAKRCEPMLLLERDRNHPDEYQFIEAELAWATWRAAVRSVRMRASAQSA